MIGRSQMKEKDNDELRGIDSNARTIEELLDRKKYTLDYYQREYNWQKNQVTDLINDLTKKFFDNYHEEDPREQVEKYDHYFLGSIIISQTGGKRFIIDGQQRLTTLTLLLIKLHHLLKDSEQKSQVASLIFSTRFAKKSFNLDIEDRETIMNVLYSDTSFDLDSLESFVQNDQWDSIRNIALRYNDIETNLDLRNEKIIPYFVDWLLAKVYLVEIIAYNEGDAYTIFETMNDRGLSLTPVEMLKGYLLANIKNTDQRNSSNEVWRMRIQLLKDIDKDEDANAIKAWLRSQYAKSIRDRTRGASPQDFELIGTEFHRWVRHHSDRLGLDSSGAFIDFIKKDFDFYTGHYNELRSASEKFIPNLECVYYNAQSDFALQYPVLLAPLRVEDSKEDINKKIRIVSRFVDILIHRRIWNFRSITHSTMYYAMYLLILAIRGKSVSDLVNILHTELTKGNENFQGDSSFGLHGTNRKKVHRILARITDFVEIQSNDSSQSRYLEYFQQGDSPYEVEHIWANKPECHIDEFPNTVDFERYRDRIGGLLLLRKQKNASFNKMSYDEKRDYYLRENLLTQSLHEKAYERNPGFLQFIERSQLPLRPHSKFKKADLDARQDLYQKLAEQIWNPERLFQDV